MDTNPSNGIINCPAPATDHLDGHGYLFGYPIAHSMSPLLHRTIFDALGLNWDYLLLPSTDITQFLNLVRDPRCYGKPLNNAQSPACVLTFLSGSGVTMPHKLAIIPKLDTLTPECRAVGAANTVFLARLAACGH